jgi:hypothetical protein
MDALTRLHRSLVGGGGDEEEDLPEESILGDTEDLCSLSQLQVKRIPSETPECRMDFILALVCIDLTRSSPFACSRGSTRSRRAWRLDSP